MSNSITEAAAKGDLGFGDYTRRYYYDNVVRLLTAAGCSYTPSSEINVLGFWKLPGSKYEYRVRLKRDSTVRLHPDLYAFYWNLESRERNGLAQLPRPLSRSRDPNVDHPDSIAPAPIPLPTVDFEVSPDELSSFKLPRRFNG